MIEMRKLRELVKLMKENDLCELDIRDQDEQVTLKRPGGQADPIVYPAAAPAAPAPSPHAEAQAAAGEAAPDDRAGLHEIVSPMVGTFYAAPSPDADPFVRVGASVDGETVVCVIEAMKVFNEIKAEVNGTIEKVLVANGEAVEFGQPLFLVRPG